jgi:hypothetical protein
MATQATAAGKVVGKVTEEISVADREVGAAIIGSGIGSVVLGIVILITEMKAGAGFKTFLNFVGPVGPLSGKTTVAVLAFAIGWVTLHFTFKNKALSLTTSFIIGVILIGLGMLFSFPPFFELFAN